MAFLMNGYSIKYTDIQYSRRCGQSRFHWRVGSKRYVVQVTRMVKPASPVLMRVC